MVMGPVTKPSGRGLGPPAEINARYWTGAIEYVKKMVMATLARTPGTLEVFRRAYQHGAQGWNHTPWGAHRVDELFREEATETEREAVAIAAAM